MFDFAEMIICFMILTIFVLLKSDVKILWILFSIFFGNSLCNLPQPYIVETLFNWATQNTCVPVMCWGRSVGVGWCGAKWEDVGGFKRSQEEVQGVR